MKAISILLLIIFFAYEQSSYSIDTLINYLQESGYYDIIQQIKLIYGDDVAISFCQELVDTGDCRTVVKIYMTPNINVSPRDDKELDKLIKDLPTDFVEDLKRLLDKYKYEEIEDFIKVILIHYYSLNKLIPNKQLLILIEKMIRLILQYYKTDKRINI